jgi:hypothetical protein
MVVGTTSITIITRNSKNESGSTVRFLFAPAQVLSRAQVLSPTGVGLTSVGTYNTNEYSNRIAVVGIHVYSNIEIVATALTLAAAIERSALARLRTFQSFI